MKKATIFYGMFFSLALSGFSSFTHALPESSHKNYTKNNVPIVIRAVNELWEYSKIMGGSILVAVGYGIVNDQVTIRVCREYFTEGFHKRMLQKKARYGNILAARMLKVTDPTKIGLFWGILATWWFGALLGAPTMLAARVGNWPKLGIKDLVQPLGVGLVGLYALAMAAGSYGYMASKNGWLSEGMKVVLSNAAGNTPASAMHRYTADAFAHHVGYFGGAFVAAGLIAWTIRERYKRAHKTKREAQ